MKSKRITMAMLMAVGALGAVSHAQVQVGNEDFESYNLGLWTSVTAPSANPQMYINGSNPNNTANIVDDGSGENKQLQLGLNLSNCWQVGITYEYAVSNNVSQNIDDYTLDFYWLMTEESVSNLLSNNRAFYLNIRDVNDTTKGSTYPLTSSDYDIALSGGVLSIPLDRTNVLAAGCNVPMDGSATEWQIQFLINGSSWQTNEQFDITIDDMVATYVEPPMLNPEGAPIGLTTTNPTMVATVYDGTSEVETMLLYLNGDLVASNSTYAGGSTTNTITYDVIGMPWGVYTGTVVAQDALANSISHSWTFFIPGIAPAAATNIVQLYNINFAGSSLDPWGGGLRPVADGRVAAAPSLGSNYWYNVDYNNPWYFGWQSKTIPEAGGSGRTCTYEMLSDSPNIGLYIPWSWGNDQQTFSDAATNTVWATAMGGGTCNINMELRNLHTDAMYDLYLYFVNPSESTAYTNTTTTYSLTSGLSPASVVSLSSIRSSLPGVNGYQTYLENTNYVVITSIMPDSSGKIAFNVFGSNAGISGMQLALRGDGEEVVPNIQTYSQTATEAYLSWDSLSYRSYSVMQKANLTDLTWTAVTNVPGSVGTTWTLVPTTADHLFFKIEGN